LSSLVAVIHYYSEKQQQKEPSAVKTSASIQTVLNPIDCTGDDYKDEIEQFQAKKQKIEHDITALKEKKKQWQEDFKSNELETKRIVAEWLESKQQKEWQADMVKKSDKIVEESHIVHDDTEKLHQEGLELKNTIMDQLGKTFQNNLETSPNLTFIKEFIADASGILTVCEECGIDFSPLLYTPNVIEAISTNCLACGRFICTSCVLKKLCVNGLNVNSVGYCCTRCMFFNCNTAGMHASSIACEIKMPSTKVRFNPIVSGVSTSESPHSYGRMLKTSDMSTPMTHNENVAQQIRFNNYHRYHQQRQQQRQQQQPPPPQHDESHTEEDHDEPSSFDENALFIDQASDLG
jgi:hypothetical protein